MIGFRILRRARKVDAQVVAAVSRDSRRQRQRLDVPHERRRSAPAARCTRAGDGGPAFTVKTRPGDNLMVHKALDLAEPGDVIVVDAGGDLTNAIIGEIMSTYANARGIAGIVIDGAIRDADEIRANDFPVYAAGVTHRGPYKDGPGEINVPVAIDGMVIEPGDLVLGDGDGILCVPYDATAAVLAAASEKQKVEAREIGAAANGRAGSRVGRRTLAPARMRDVRANSNRRKYDAGDVAQVVIGAALLAVAAVARAQQAIPTGRSS